MDREERRALVSFSIKFTRSFLFVLLACNLIEINTPVPPLTNPLSFPFHSASFIFISMKGKERRRNEAKGTTRQTIRLG